MGDKLVYMLTKSFQRSQYGNSSFASSHAGGEATKGKSSSFQGSQDFLKELLKVEYNQMLAKNLFYEF